MDDEKKWGVIVDEEDSENYSEASILNVQSWKEGDIKVNKTNSSYGYNLSKIKLELCSRRYEDEIR